MRWLALLRSNSGRLARVAILLASSSLLSGCAAGIIIAAVGIVAATGSDGSDGDPTGEPHVEKLSFQEESPELRVLMAQGCNDQAQSAGDDCPAEPNSSILHCGEGIPQRVYSGAVKLLFNLSGSQSRVTLFVTANGAEQEDKTFGPFSPRRDIPIAWDSCNFGKTGPESVNLRLAAADGNDPGVVSDTSVVIDNRLPPLACIVHAFESRCSDRAWEHCLVRSGSKNNCQGVSGDPTVQPEDFTLLVFDGEQVRCVGSTIKEDEPCSDPTHIGPFVTRWETREQFSGESDDVTPILRVSTDDFRDGFHDLQCASGCLRVDNSAPRVVGLEVSSVPQGERNDQELIGNVVLRYTLVDLGSEPANIFVSARLPTGETLSTRRADDLTLSELCGFSSDESDGVPLSDGTSNLSTSPTGVPHVFVWNSDADIDRRLTDPNVGNVTIEIGVINECFSDPDGRKKHDGVLNNELVHSVVGVLPSRTRRGDNSVERSQIRFESPASIAIAGTDLLVADSATNIIWRLPYPGGAELTRIAGTGTLRSPDDIPSTRLEAANTASLSALNEPVDLVALENRVFILERSGFLLDIVQNKLRRLLPRDLNNQRLQEPLALAHGPEDGFLYIADTENCRIVRFEIATQKTDVIFGLDLDSDGRLDMPFDVILPGRNGCGKLLQDLDTNCAPNFRRAIAGIAYFRSSGGQRFLFASQTLDERILLIPLDGGPLTDRQLKDGGTVLEQDGRCPDVSLLSRPKGLRVIREGDSAYLYIMSDGVRERARGARGVVLRSRIVDEGDTPTLERPELIAGTIRSDCGEISVEPCTCTDTNASSFLPEDECGQATGVPLANPSTVAMGPDGKLLICDRLNQRVRMLTGDEECELQTFVGGTVEGKSAPEMNMGLPDRNCITPAPCDRDGTESAPASKLAEPYSIVFLDPSTLLITDGQNRRIRRLDLQTGLITTAAGREKTEREISRCIDFVGEGRPATEAVFKLPQGIAIFPRYRPRIDETSAFPCDPNRKIFVADTLNHVIRLIDARGVITTYAGSGVPAARTGDCCPDRPATSSNRRPPAPPLRVFLQRPRALTVDGAGRLFITDCRHRVLMVNPEGTLMTRVAGRGSREDDTDNGPIELCGAAPDYDPVTTDLKDGGPPTEALLWNPGEMVFDREEKFMYLADRGNNRIRRLTYDKDTGTFTEIVTVAGTGDRLDTFLPGDRACRPAREVGLNGPYGLDIDPLTNTLISTTEVGARVYRIQIDEDPDQFQIEPISGDVRIGVGGDGDAVSSAGFTSPASVRFDRAGNVYLNDVRNHRLRRFTLPPPCEAE